MLYVLTSPTLVANMLHCFSLKSYFPENCQIYSAWSSCPVVLGKIAYLCPRDWRCETYHLIGRALEAAWQGSKLSKSVPPERKVFENRFNKLSLTLLKSWILSCSIIIMYQQFNLIDQIHFYYCFICLFLWKWSLLRLSRAGEKNESIYCPIRQKN